jgi:hypothetical protein
MLSLWDCRGSGSGGDLVYQPIEGEGVRPLHKEDGVAAEQIS